MMNLNLAGKNALVCGGSKGIGKAVAIELAGLGANVIVAARSSDLLAEIVTHLPNSVSQNHGFLVIDMQSPEELVKKVRTLSMTRTIHILVNNSGGPPGGPILLAKPEEFTQAMQAHLLASHQLVTLLSPGMKQEKFGRIINIISTSVKEPIAGLGVSNTVRGAMASWAKTVSLELAPFGVTVNNILPGFTRTQRLESLVENWAGQRKITIADMENELFEVVPMGRFANPEEIAAVAAFLATPAASYVTGVSLAVDGGRTKSI